MTLSASLPSTCDGYSVLYSAWIIQLLEFRPQVFIIIIFPDCLLREDFLTTWKKRVIYCKLVLGFTAVVLFAMWQLDRAKTVASQPVRKASVSWIFGLIIFDFQQQILQIKILFCQLLSCWRWIFSWMEVESSNNVLM